MVNDRPMTPGQAADFLDVGTTALKKYALLLEQNGYSVGRNDKNHRVYTSGDMAVIRAMLILNRHKSVALEEAASIVTSADTDIAEILSYDDTGVDTNSGVHNTEPTVTTTHVATGTQHIADLMTQLQERDKAYKNFMTLVETTLKEQAVTIEVLREELQERDKRQIESTGSISESMKQQMETIEAMRKEIEALRKQQVEQAAKPTSFWGRLFGGK